MQAGLIEKKTFKFLKDLKANNQRDWFAEHKHRYEAAHQNMITFAEELMAQMSEHDNLVEMSGKKSLYRIYRDVRFSKNKAPYKTHWAGSMKRATQWLRGGYYFHIEEGKSFAAGGFWAPNKEDLQRIRLEFAADPEPMREIIAEKRFVDTFGSLDGEQLKTAPKGFPKDHPSIDLLRYKQFIVHKSFSDKEVFSEEFIPKMVDAFTDMRPFFDYMSDVLTTDTNGVRIGE